jgi:hypothetical protein
MFICNGPAYFNASVQVTNSEDMLAVVGNFHNREAAFSFWE